MHAGPAAFWSFDCATGSAQSDTASGITAQLGAHATLRTCAASSEGGAPAGSCTLRVSNQQCCSMADAAACLANGFPESPPCDDTTQGSVMSVDPVPAAISFDGLAAFTVSAWVYLAQYPAGGANLVSRWYALDQFGLSIDGSSLSFAVAFTCQGADCNDPGKQAWGAAFAVQGGTVPLNQWAHVAGMLSGGQVTVFINGEAVNSVSVPAEYVAAGVQATGVPLFVGGHPTWNQFSGQIDCLALYSTAADVPVEYASQQSTCGCSEGALGMV